jgi:hypothetical protein
MSALPRALHAVVGQHSRATLSSLAVNLWFASLSCRCHGTAWDEKSIGGDGANLIVDGIVTGLGRPVPA